LLIARTNSAVTVSAVVIAASTLVACSTISRHPVPESAVLDDVPGVPGQIRFWGDERPKNLEALVREIEAQRRSASSTQFDNSNYLALSGGGADGAFGAGVLVGWSEAGTRPTFDVVTGISTGALIAPFAFLGSAYDGPLEEAYTTHESWTIARSGGLASIIGEAALVDNSGLVGLVDQYVSPDLLSAVAREYRRGRRLYIGTTHLDAQRPVIWDMGAIASQGDVNALKLFRQILVASTSVPGVFPPVLISVDQNGSSYDEMHVDGGVTREVFLFPGQFDLRKFDNRRSPVPRRRLFVIRNAKLGPEWQSVEPGLLKIGHRSVSTLIKNQGWGDLDRVYLQARASNIEFNLASIPETFTVREPQPLDVGYRKALFDFGYKLARIGYPWRKAPPDVNPAATRNTMKLFSSGYAPMPADVRSGSK
jgi:Patatin-like phospholipase